MSVCRLIPNVTPANCSISAQTRAPPEWGGAVRCVVVTTGLAARLHEPTTGKVSRSTRRGRTEPLRLQTRSAGALLVPQPGPTSVGYAQIKGTTASRPDQSWCGRHRRRLRCKPEGCSCEGKASLSQGQLAERAALLQQYVSLVESGKHNITFATAQALAKAVDRDVRTLLTPLRPRKR
jgi:DNA-binding XRE family transcriptional regulator